MKIAFDGQVVVVTGGAGSLGRAASAAFLEAGARRVVLVDAAAEPLAAARAELERQHPGHVAAVVADLGEAEAAREAMRRVLDVEGDVDVLYNTAGLNRRKPALEITPEDWELVLGVNLRGVFFATQEIGRRMVARGRGAIVNTGSVSSVRGHRTLAPYAASKGGVAQMTRVLANEWAPHGVRVNAVAPGYFETGLTRGYLGDPAVRAGILAKIPMGRIGAPEDLVGAVLFLASDWARYITGTVLFVDGGRTVD
jgi:NAD(P)-dependent dehydrogenase (short-subunit alcohol dehydrogenase family)